MAEGNVELLGSRIAQGRQAEVYASGTREDAVIKLYRSGFGGDAAEAAALTWLDGSGIAPRLIGTVTIDGRAGLLLERLDGLDMLTLLERQPWRLAGLARMLAHAALGIHRVRAPLDLPDLTDVLGEAIAAADLDTRLRDFALRVLDSLPAGDRLCHGDLHPGNAVITALGPSVIDWPAATRGVPAADLARTLLLLRQADPLPGTPFLSRMLISTGRSVFATMFSRTYRAGSPHPLSDMDSWTVVHAAGRLAEGITVERRRLVDIVESAYRASDARWLSGSDGVKT